MPTEHQHTPPVGPPRPRARHTAHPRTLHEVSADGLVLDVVATLARCLLISRFDRRGRIVWSFPKGHIEEGETSEQAALREVREETGMSARILDPIGKIDFWFQVEDRRIHKTGHHYLMRATGGALSDEDPEVESVEWVDLDRVRGRLAYSDERSLLDKARGMLVDRAS